jgi:hypothetical protein
VHRTFATGHGTVVGGERAVRKVPVKITDDTQALSVVSFTASKPSGNCLH